MVSNILDGRDRLIRIERSSEGSFDAAGTPTVVWATLVDLWAREVPMSGGESLRMDRQISTQISRFFTLYYAGITVKDRISYDGKYWDIVNVRRLERVGLEITAEVVK